MTDPCSASDHRASDCSNPRSAEGVECKRCSESKSIEPQRCIITKQGTVGHFAKDCPQAPAPRTCRNCG
ncbi:hypothetical protein BDV12DRAFT_176771 [Aspergillus spectabilis]